MIKININGSSTIFFLYPDESSCTPTGVHTPLFGDQRSVGSLVLLTLQLCKVQFARIYLDDSMHWRQSVPTCKKAYTSRHMSIKKDICLKYLESLYTSPPMTEHSNFIQFSHWNEKQCQEQKPQNWEENHKIDL